MATHAENPSKAADAAPVASKLPNLSLAEDIRLMDLARKGDRDAYSAMIKRFSHRIHAVAYMMLHSGPAADDVVQETFTKGLQAIATYRAEGSPHSWFLSIAVNLCRRSLRDAKIHAGLADDEALDGGCSPRRDRTRGVVTRCVHRETERLLPIALGYLTLAQREVFVLHHKDGLPYEEIGQILGIRAGTARALAHRAKLNLQKRLGA